MSAIFTARMRVVLLAIFSSEGTVSVPFNVAAGNPERTNIFCAQRPTPGAQVGGRIATGIHVSNS